MKVYELTVVFKPDLTEKELDHEVATLQTLLEKNKGKIVKKSDPEKKTLAYEIGKFREGYYVYLEAELPAEAISEVEGKIKLMDNVIRHLIVSQKSKVKSQK